MGALTKRETTSPATRSETCISPKTQFSSVPCSEYHAPPQRTETVSGNRIALYGIPVIGSVYANKNEAADNPEIFKNLLLNTASILNPRYKPR